MGLVGGRNRAVLGGWVVLACALLYGGLAHAQSDAEKQRDQEARALYESATMAFQQGRHEVALERFREALELSGRPTLYYNIGVAADRLRRNEEALEAFKNYLDQVPSSADRAEVEARVRVLEETIARAAASANASDANGGTEPNDQGDTDEPTVTAPTPEEAAAAAVAAEGEPGDPAMTSTDADGSEAKPVTSKWWFWTIVGVAVVGVVGLGVGLAVSDGGVQGPLPGTNGEHYETLLEAR